VCNFLDIQVNKHSKVMEDICKKIIEGKTISNIAKCSGFPPAYTIHLWRKKYPEFEKALDYARELRGDFLYDQALEMCQKEINKGDVPQMKLKFQILKWAAAIDNSKYKEKNEAKYGGGHTIIVNTGIDRTKNDFDIEFSDFEEKINN
jgi:hypothetical protein